MKRAAHVPPCSKDIMRAIITYSRAVHSGQPVSLKAALGDLRTQLPHLKMSDQALASVIAEAAFKEGHDVNFDLPIVRKPAHGRAAPPPKVVEPQ